MVRSRPKGGYLFLIQLHLKGCLHAVLIVSVMLGDDMALHPWNVIGEDDLLLPEHSVS